MTRGFGSFGAPAPDPEPEPPDLGGPVVMLPPLVLDSIQVPIAFVIDEESLAVLSARVRDAIVSAVLGGFEDATGIRIDPDAPPPE